jgi:outer membrane receptor protein involved in Fe transport
VAPSVTLRASGYEAFRAPALSEEYRQFLAGNLVFAPNRELGPEHLIGADAGVDWRPVSHVELRFTAFYNHMRDLGAFAFLAPGYLQRQNVGTARAEGLEGELGIDPLPGLHLSGSYDYDDARNTSGSGSGTRVSRIPLQRADGRITYDSPFWGDYGIVLQYEGQNTSLSGAPLTPYTIVNLHAGHSVRGDLGVFLNVENLFNRTYPIDNSGGLISIGMPFTIRLGVRMGE